MASFDKYIAEVSRGENRERLCAMTGPHKALPHSNSHTNSVWRFYADPLPGRPLPPTSPKLKPRLWIKIQVDRKMDLAMRRRCNALGIPRSVYLRELVQSDLDSAATNSAAS